MKGQLLEAQPCPEGLGFPVLEFSLAASTILFLGEDQELDLKGRQTVSSFLEYSGRCTHVPSFVHLSLCIVITVVLNSWPDNSNMFPVMSGSDTCSVFSNWVFFFFVGFFLFVCLLVCLVVFS